MPPRYRRLQRARERSVWLVVMPALVLVGVAVAARTWVSRSWPEITVYRTEHCHCAERWIRSLERSRFRVKSRLEQSLTEVRARLGVPPSFTFCHTAVIEQLVIEGHVPADDVRRALVANVAGRGSRTPKSTSVEDGRAAAYDVLTWDSEEQVARYVRRVGQIDAVQ